MVRVRYCEGSPALLPTAYPLVYTWKSFLLSSHALFLQGFCERYLGYENRPVFVLSYWFLTK